jgi:hypothetical protein
VVLGKDQVDAGSREIAGEKQVGIRNDDRVRRSVRRVLSNGLDMGVRTGMRPMPINRQVGGKFACVIQWATAKRLIFT